MEKNKSAYLFILIGILTIGIFIVFTNYQVSKQRNNRNLISAIKCNDIRSIMLLLANGADANTRDDANDTLSFWQWWLNVLHGRQLQPTTSPTAMSIALNFGFDTNNDRVIDNYETVKALLDFGADPNVCDKGVTPLTVASTGKQKTVKVLLDHGANVNVQDSDGQTALMLATRWGQENICKILLERNANTNIQDSEGRTALMIAVNGQNERIVQLLLHWKANVYIKSKFGETALLDAQKKMPEYLQIMLNRH